MILKKPAISVAGFFRRLLLHQQHLARAFDCPIQPPLIMSGQTGILAGEDAALISDKLPKQICVFEIQGIGGKIDLRFGPRRADFHDRSAAAPATTAVRFIWASFARHKVDYLISRWSV